MVLCFVSYVITHVKIAHNYLLAALVAKLIPSDWIKQELHSHALVNRDISIIRLLCVLLVILLV